MRMTTRKVTRTLMMSDMSRPFGNAAADRGEIRRGCYPVRPLNVRRRVQVPLREPAVVFRQDSAGGSGPARQRRRRFGDGLLGVLDRCAALDVEPAHVGFAKILVGLEAGGADAG